MTCIRRWVNGRIIDVAAHDLSFAQALERACPQLEQARLQITGAAYKWWEVVRGNVA